MSDSELRPHGEQDEPEGDLSAFENALGDDLLDSLPPAPTDEKSGKKETEGGIIRKVLQELAEKYGFEYQIYDGRELGYGLALNHRLDDMIYTSPQGLSDEIALAIQANKVTQEQADEIFEHLTAIEGLDTKDEHQLETHLYHIYEVLEVVVVDPQKLFESDIAAQSRLQTSLQMAANAVQDYIENKPQRDREPLPAKGFLAEQIDDSMRRIRQNFANWHPELAEQMVPIYEKIKAAIEAVPDDLQESRGHLMEILEAASSVSSISLADEPKLIVDERKLADVLVLISDL